MTGSFTATSAGGNSGFPSFMVNPQYKLSVQSPPGTTAAAMRRARVEVVVHAARTLPLNVVAVWAGGARVFE